jgi:ATP-dependent Lon protease
MIAKLVRNRARQIALEENFEVKLKADEIYPILGIGRSRTKYDNNLVAGVVTGLAWTSVGGDILFIESSITKGKGKLTLTGNLGEVMKESAIIALEYLKSHSNLLGLNQEVFDKYNVHIHVPEGATPKDGPSAGITMLTSLASLFSQRKVKKQLAMTGEITLRGEVLPVGGIKEKVLAAKRASIKEIILCEKNRRDIDEIKDSYLVGLTFHYVSTMKEVLNLALLEEKVIDPIEIV